MELMICSSFSLLLSTTELDMVMSPSNSRFTSWCSLGTWVGGGLASGASDRQSMPTGRRLTSLGGRDTPANHSVLVIAGCQVTLVSGNRSSWNSSDLSLGTLKERGSTLPVVRRKALANSTSPTLQASLGRNETAWWGPLHL
uniref:Secreted protein n=1 Tax=Ixodes ricinus TaxID=34613 RepID=A0A6B0UU72_IXORI